MWPFAEARSAAAATFLRRVASHHLLFHVSNVFLFGHRLWNQENQKTGRKWAKICISADFRVRGRELDVRARERLRPREIEIRARGSLHAFLHTNSRDDAVPANHFVRARELFVCGRGLVCDQSPRFSGFFPTFLPFFTLLNPFFFHKILVFFSNSSNSSS